MPPHSARPAFTLIELLVVLAIIGALAGIILAAYRPLREAQLRNRTAHILSIAATALESGRLDHGSLPDAAEHPFAGSKQPRLRFRGERGGSWQDLPSGGEALVGVDAARIDPAAAGRLLQPDDLFAEPAFPAFFGVRRQAMGVLGVPQANLSRALVLSAYGGSGLIPMTDLSNVAMDYLPYEPLVNRNESGAPLPNPQPLITADGAYPALTAGNPRFPASRFLSGGCLHQLRRAYGNIPYKRNEYWMVHSTPYDSATLFQRFMQSGVMDELRAMGGLREAPLGDHGLSYAAWDAGAYAEHLYRRNGIVSGPSVPHGWDARLAHRKEKATDSYGYGEIAALPDSTRVWSTDPGKAAYEPGRILDNGTWKTYLLRGLALYDAWGTEILYQRTGRDTFVLVSAGRDRCFAIRPRDDGSFATDISSGYAGAPTGPDRDATIDNISTDKLQ